METKSDFEQHKFLKILKFAYENTTFTKDEICKKLTLTENEFERNVVGIASHDPNHDGTGKQKWAINYEAFINYLEYIELNDARRSSKKATWIAIIAISLSIISMVVSIHYSRTQLKTPTKIEKAQFEKIEKLNFDPDSIEEKIDTLIKNQEKLIKILNKKSDNVKISNKKSVMSG